MPSRAAKAFETPIPVELAESGEDILYLHREAMRYRHVTGGRMQEMESRLRGVEGGLKALIASHEASAAEILRRIGRDDADGSFGLTGTVAGLVRAVGVAPDQDGQHGSGLRGDIHQLKRRIKPFERLRDAFKTLWPLLAIIAGLMAFILKDQLAHLLSVPVH